MTQNNLEEKLEKIKAVAFDGDGVFFSGRVFVDSEKGEVIKERSHIDGQGISLLRAVGIKVAIISSEKTGFLEKIGEKLNNLPSVRDGKWDKIAIFTGPQGSQKVETLDVWLKENNLEWEELAVMGDDLADYQMLQKAGFAVVPSQGEEVVRAIADYVAPRKGGDGAIRDLCNLILKAKKIDPTSLTLR